MKSYIIITCVGTGDDQPRVFRSYSKSLYKHAYRLNRQEDAYVEIYDEQGKPYSRLRWDCREKAWQIDKKFLDCQWVFPNPETVI